MAYLAFYRTFRPTTFDEVVRQEHIVMILRNQIETGRIGHAYLFCGPRGTGKTTLAKIFARAINCENPQNGSPCGKCPTCLSLAGGSALDISEIDAASNNGVDEMRDLREKVQYPPVNGKYKVYIIDEVHMLTQSAFNAVLKTLEEPPRHAVFILATTEPQKIPATILSRCMRFDFKLIPQADLENLIKDVLGKTGKEYEDEAVAAIARAGNGSARDSLSIADMCASYSRGKLTYEDVNKVLGKADFQAIGEIASAVVEGNAGDALTATENVLSTGKGVGVLLRDLLDYFNGLAIAKTCRNAEQILNLPKEKFSALNAVASGAGGHTILRATEILAAVEGELRFAVDGRITLETAIIKAATPQTERDDEALLARIELLERAVKEGVKVQIRQGSEERGAQNRAPASEEAKSPLPSSAPAENVNKLGAPREDISRQALGGNGQTQVPREETRREADRIAPRLTELEEGFAPSPFGGSAPAANQGAGGITGGGDNFEQSTLFEQSGAAPSNVGSLSEADKRAAFGKFIRLFRTTRKNAVLFTLCMDLESFFEGDKFVLLTESEAVCRSLNREENRQFIGEALREIGVFSFEIRLKQKGENKYEKALGELRDNFKDNDIEIK